VVDDVDRAEPAALAEHDAGRGVGVDREVAHIDAFATQTPHDRGPETIGADPAQVRDAVAESREPDGDVGLGACDVPFEVDRIGKGAGRRGHERREALTDGDDLAHDRPQFRAALAAATASTAWRLRSAIVAADPSPKSQLPIPTATAPASM